MWNIDKCVQWPKEKGQQIQAYQMRKKIDPLPNNN